MILMNNFHQQVVNFLTKYFGGIVFTLEYFKGKFILFIFNPQFQLYDSNFKKILHVKSMAIWY